MKKIILCTALALLLVAVGTAANRYFKSDDMSMGSIPVISETADTSYTVKKYGEKIGIFQGTDDSPVKTLGVFVFTLPETDRNMLEYGFEISEDCLDSLICDYTG